MNILRELILIAFCFFSVNLSAQFVNYKMSPGDSAHAVGNHRLSINLYVQEGQKTVDGNCLNIAGSYLVLGMSDSAIYFLK